MALVAKAATPSIPIVFSAGTDPIENGLVAAFNRSGGNATGALQFNDKLIVKRMELLRDMVPKLATVGLLVDTTSAASPGRIAAVQAAAATAQQPLRVYNVTSPDQFDATFAMLAQDKVGALLAASRAFPKFESYPP